MERYTNLMLIGLLAYWLTGCTSYLKLVDYTDKVIHVTAGYDTQKHIKGDEFLFSLRVPKGQWNHNEYFNSASKGYVELWNKNKGPQFQFEWNWHSERVMQESLDEKSFGIPWYTGVKGSGKRNIHTPTAVDTNYMVKPEAILLY